MRQRLIACGGMYRSGSTWQHNAVRSLVEASHPGLEIYSCWIETYDPSHSADVHIVKIHALNQLGLNIPDIILTSFRDLRAVAGSLIRMGWLPSSSDAVCLSLEAYITDETIIRAVANYRMRYEVMVATPMQVLRETAAALDLILETADIELVHDRLHSMAAPIGEPSGDFLEFDAATLLHRGHVGGITNAAALKFLAPSIEADIDLRFAGWLSEHCYPAHRCGG